MTKHFIKTTIAAICVVAASMSGIKVYNTSHKSDANVLLAENIEALSAADKGVYGYKKTTGQCPSPYYKSWVICQGWVINGDPNCQNSDC